jgi:endonuclease/exonuclease/phosphatase family metal-dependent hydrolase
VAALSIKLLEREITIINVYNPRGDAPTVQEWPRITQAAREAQGSIILLGDFNTHHSAWGGIGVACEQQGEHLLHETRREGLELINQQGEITWRRGTQETTIDLAFISHTLSNRVEFYGTVDAWALTQDHIPIKLVLDIRTGYGQQPQRKRYALKKLDTEGLLAAIRESNLGSLSDIQ